MKTTAQMLQQAEAHSAKMEAAGAPKRVIRASRQRVKNLRKKQPKLSKDRS